MMVITPHTFDDAAAAVAMELVDLLISKQRDYGHGNILAFGELGVLVRANDKIERLKNLLIKKQEPSNESVEDTWRDLANYAIIALMLRRKTQDGKSWFELPLGQAAEPITVLESMSGQAIVDDWLTPGTGGVDGTEQGEGPDQHEAQANSLPNQRQPGQEAAIPQPGQEH